MFEILSNEQIEEALDGTNYKSAHIQFNKVATAQRDKDLKELNEWKDKPDSSSKFWWFDGELNEDELNRHFFELVKYEYDEKYKKWIVEIKGIWYWVEACKGKFCKLYIPQEVKE
jgi:hypothetical protein